MLRNYITLAVRNILRNKVAAGINLLGLAVAVGCSLVAYLYVYRVNNPEWFHENADRIFYLYRSVEIDGNRMLQPSVPSDLGATIGADFPQVEHVVRTQTGSARVQKGQDTLEQGVLYVDPGFLDAFTFPLALGHRDALSSPDAALLSSETAQRFFGTEDPMGRTLDVSFKNGGKSRYTIRGVLEAELGKRSNVQFQIIRPYAARDEQADTENEPHELTWATYLVLRDAAAAAEVSDGLAAYLDRFTAHEEKVQTRAFILAPFGEQGHRHGRRIEPQLLLVALAGVLLLLACFNYMNTSLAAANRRLKEIGIRKVVGSHRRQLVAQFLTENTVLCVLAFVVGVYLAHHYILPAFNEISREDLSLVHVAGQNIGWYLLALLLGVALLSGAYPAFFISAFQPTAIFRGRARMGHRNIFMQVMLTAQFTLTCAALVTSVGIAMGARALHAHDWGYDQEQTITIATNREAQFAAVSKAASELPDVISMAGSVHQLGKRYAHSKVEVGGKSLEINRFDVGPAWFETHGIRLASGAPPQTEDAVIVNQTFVQRVGLKSPLGETVRLGERDLTIAGVAADFHYESFNRTIQPAFVRIVDPSHFRVLAVRVRPETGIRTAEALTEAWKAAFPDTDLNLRFQDEVFDTHYKDVRGILQVLGFTALVALIISCAGLFGLAAQHLAARLKEVSIRKILGATAAGAGFLVFRRFLALLGVAAILAVPIGRAALGVLLGTLDRYGPDLGPAPYAIALLLLAFTAGATVSTLVRQVGSAAPADLLRDE